MSHPQTVRSEDEVSRKWDACISDSIIKLGGGVGLGAVFSLLFFKRRAWPIIFGAGLGVGGSISNCQHAFQNPYVARPIRKPLAIAPKSSSLSLKPEVPRPHSPLDDHPPQFNDREMKDVDSPINGLRKH